MAPASTAQASGKGHDHDETPVKKLVLCFDGTGNKFSGSSGDTNIVKLYHKLNREDDDNQFHYYQTGIGTYDLSSGSLNKGFFGSITSSISRSLDSGFGTTFDAHVIAGYRFIMRYYDCHDRIYLFGFSRGAFTARFLARMINTIGLLSKGNEEMVPFAYQLYQTYEQGVRHERRWWRAKADEEANKRKILNEVAAFRNTFCRQDKTGEVIAGVPQKQPVKIHFLGLFDCVSSVAVLESGRGSKPLSVIGTASHVRHAVAVDERRTKFRAALLNRDIADSENRDEDIKEVWFPGNHGDVGGGWPTRVPTEWRDQTWGQYIKSWFPSSKQPDAEPDTEHDTFQMSDVPLSWMMQELDLVDQEYPNPIMWNAQRKVFEDGLREKGIKAEQSRNMPLHDTLKLGGGSNVGKVLLWNFMECLPFLPRWELIQGVWKQEWFRPNFWGTRDIPANALLHHSLIWRLQHYKDNGKGYTPKNNHGDAQNPCLVHHNLVKDPKNPVKDEIHAIWTFDTAGTSSLSAAKSTEHLLGRTSVAAAAGGSTVEPVGEDMTPPQTPNTLRTNFVEESNSSAQIVSSPKAFDSISTNQITTSNVATA